MAAHITWCKSNQGNRTDRSGYIYGGFTLTQIVGKHCSIRGKAWWPENEDSKHVEDSLSELELWILKGWSAEKADSIFAIIFFLQNNTLSVEMTWILGLEGQLKGALNTSLDFSLLKTSLRSELFHHSSFKCGKQSFRYFLLPYLTCTGCYFVYFVYWFYPDSNIWSHFLGPPLSYDDPHSCLNTTTFLSH